mgnify:CR=1 FL=1
MANIKCKICDTLFYVKPYRLKRGWGKYCSNKCQYKESRTGSMVTCSMCDKEVYRTPRQIKCSKSNKFFCDKSCQTKWRNTVFIGPKHKNWVDGSASYRNVLGRNGVKQICKSCKNDDKRILAIHHLDRNRKNNKAENLAWLCHNCHFLVHHDIVER